jgi:hypothetical protein
VATTYPSGVAECALRKGNGTSGLRFVDKAIMRSGDALRKSYMDVVMLDESMTGAGIGLAQLSTLSFDVVTSKVVVARGSAAPVSAAPREGDFGCMQEWFAQGLFAGGGCEGCSVTAGPCLGCRALRSSGSVALEWTYVVTACPSVERVYTRPWCFVPVPALSYSLAPR